MINFTLPESFCKSNIVTYKAASLPADSPLAGGGLFYWIELQESKGSEGLNQ